QAERPAASEEVPGRPGRLDIQALGARPAGPAAEAVRVALADLDAHGNHRVRPGREVGRHRGAPHDLHAKEPALRLQELARAEEVPGLELERAHDRALVEAPGADDGDLPVAGPRPRLDL